MPQFSELVNDWREFERFIEGLYRNEESVQVRRDVELIDSDGAPRQVDVLVSFKRGPHFFTIIIECKYWSKKVERQDVDALLMTVQKTRASKGAIFTTCGYQSGALTIAKANGIDVFLVRDPLNGEWWPQSSEERYLQVCSSRPENRVDIPSDAVEVGTEGEWPPGIQIPPPVRFGRDRTCTPLLMRADRMSLEELIEITVRNNLVKAVSNIGVIGGGRDCVGHFTIRVDFKFEGPLWVQERLSPFVVLRISKFSVNAAVMVEQRRICIKSPLELDSCALVEDCVSGAMFQVSRSTPEGPFLWVDMLSRPLFGGLPDRSRTVVISGEPIHPECFEGPWSTFGKVANYETSDVPQTRTLARVLQLLNDPKS